MQAINLSANDYRKAKSGYIYFAESKYQGLPVIKIGYTSKWNVQLRITELEKEYGLKFALLFYIPGDIADEKGIHAKYNDRNVPNFKDNRGNLKKELFWLADDLRTYVYSLKQNKNSSSLAPKKTETKLAPKKIKASEEVFLASEIKRSVPKKLQPSVIRSTQAQASTEKKGHTMTEKRCIVIGAIVAYSLVNAFVLQIADGIARTGSTSQGASQVRLK